MADGAGRRPGADSGKGDGMDPERKDQDPCRLLLQYVSVFLVQALFSPPGGCSPLALHQKSVSKKNRYKKWIRRKKMENRIVRYLYRIIVMIIIGLIVMVLLPGRREQEKQTNHEKAESLLRPLRVEKRDLEQKLDALERKYENQVHSSGTASILFTDLDQRIYTEIYPVMEKYELTGTVVISKTSLPDQYGRMTTAQIRELLSAGWKCCPGWQTGNRMTDMAELEKVIAGFGDGTSDAIYFEKGTYTQAYDAELIKAGYKTVIHHGEEGLALVGAGSEKPLWHTGAIGFLGNEPAAKLLDAMDKKEHINYTVGYTLEEEKYNVSQFSTMLRKLSSYSKNGKLIVMSPWDAREYYKSISGEQRAAEKKTAKKKEELKEEIEKVETRMQAIRDEYYG